MGIGSRVSLTVLMIFSATHTGDNEFKLDRVPLGQVRWVWSKEKVVWCVGRIGGESEGSAGGARLIRRVELTISESAVALSM